MAWLLDTIAGLFWNPPLIRNVPPPLQDAPQWLTGILEKAWWGILDVALRICFSATLKSMIEIDGDTNKDRQEATWRIAAGRCIERSKFSMFLAIAFASTSFIGSIAATPSSLSQNAFTMSAVAGLHSAIMEGCIVWGLGIEGVMAKLRNKRPGVLSVLSMVIPAAAVWHFSWIAEVVALYDNIWGSDSPHSMKYAATTIFPSIFFLFVWNVGRNLPSSLRPDPEENV